MFFGLLYILCLRFCPNVFWPVIYPLFELLSQCFFGLLYRVYKKKVIQLYREIIRELLSV